MESEGARHLLLLAIRQGYVFSVASVHKHKEEE